jgi:hypothetical protein
LTDTSSTSTPFETDNAAEARSSEPRFALVALVVALAVGVTAAWIFVLVSLARWLF